MSALVGRVGCPICGELVQIIGTGDIETRPASVQLDITPLRQHIAQMHPRALIDGELAT